MKIALRASINEKWLSAEYGGGIDSSTPTTIALTANRDEVGGFETFEEVKLPNGCFALKTFRGFYLTADIDGSLRSVATEIGAWENFRWQDKLIKTFHGLNLTARVDKDNVPIETTENDGEWEFFDRLNLEPINRREGIVTAYGRAAQDTTGTFHPLGLTFFWALHGWKFERHRIIQHLEWLKQHNFDYLRILGEVNWKTRPIDPNWPDYQTILAEFVDCAYDNYGLRVEMTITGGQYQRGIENKIVEVLNERAHKVMHYEVCNEWERLDKIPSADLIRVGTFLAQNTPNLVSLSTPKDSYAPMIQMSEQAGVNMYTLHLRRSDHDVKWSHVRQGYDLKNFPDIISNNEPQGPQSSVKTLEDPMQLAMARATGIVCAGSFYVLHVGQGVTGQADPNHNRPENMWEVPNIDKTMQHVRLVDNYLPEGIENWKVVNNGRNDHPMPLDPRLGHGFWEGTSGGSVNKNFACIRGDQFVEVLLGVNNGNDSGPTDVGTPINNSRITTIDMNNFSEGEIDGVKGQKVYLNGRRDKMAGYIVQGNL